MNQASQPKVALLMLTYNHADCLSESINRVLSQTYQNFTLIVVDDSSEDQSFEIAKEFECYDSRVTVSKNTNNLGMFQNFEINLLETFENIDFDYFGWLGPDDDWSNDWLESLVLIDTQEDSRGVRQSFVTYQYEHNSEIREYVDFSSQNLSFSDTKQLRKGYGELMHGLWDRETVESIIHDSRLVPFKYLLKLENLFISLLVEKRGFTAVNRPLHTKKKAIGSRFRYQKSFFFQNPNRILLVAIKAFPGIIKLIIIRRKNYMFILGSFLIDVRIAIPKQVKV